MKLGSTFVNLTVSIKSAIINSYLQVSFWCWKTLQISRERGGETGKQTKWQRHLEIGLSETERKKGRFCFLLNRSSVKPELPFPKPTCVQDLREATMKLSCSLSKALSDFHSPTSTYSPILPLLLLLSKTILGEYLHTQEWENLHSKVRWKLQLCKRNGAQVHSSETRKVLHLLTELFYSQTSGVSQ